MRPELLQSHIAVALHNNSAMTANGACMMTLILFVMPGLVPCMTGKENSDRYPTPNVSR